MDGFRSGSIRSDFLKDEWEDKTSTLDRTGQWPTIRLASVIHCLADATADSKLSYLVGVVNVDGLLQWDIPVPTTINIADP